MNVAIKICGIKDKNSVQAAIDSGADFIGFVHHLKSPRHVSIDDAAHLTSSLPDSINSVIVLVNPDDDLLKNITCKIGSDFFQLHGNETVERIGEIRRNFPDIKIIKSVGVSKKNDMEKAKYFYDIADFILFDAKPENKGMAQGGNGMVFDWSLLATNELPEKWFLSGGLNAENIQSAISQTNAKFIDVSSGVEESRGVKNSELIEKFIKAARK